MSGIDPLLKKKRFADMLQILRPPLTASFTFSEIMKAPVLLENL